MTLTELEERFPDIPWRKPLKVSTTTGEWGYACRVCVANEGLRGSEIHLLTQNKITAQRHIAEQHP